MDIFTTGQNAYLHQLISQVLDEKTLVVAAFWQPWQDQWIRAYQKLCGTQSGEIILITPSDHLSRTLWIPNFMELVCPCVMTDFLKALCKKPYRPSCPANIFLARQSSSSQWLWWKTQHNYGHCCMIPCILSSDHLDMYFRLEFMHKDQQECN